MKFLLDESAELCLAAYLREQGHDVTTVAADYQASLDDEQVLAIAKAEGRASSRMTPILGSWCSDEVSRARG